MIRGGSMSEICCNFRSFHSCAPLPRTVADLLHIFLLSVLDEILCIVFRRSVPAAVISSLTANSFTKLFAFSTTFYHCRIVDSHFLNPGQQCYDDSGKSVLLMSFCISAVAAAFKRLFNSRGVFAKPIAKRTGWNFKALSNILLA